jgi:pilus assembly protein CpaF
MWGNLVVDNSTPSKKQAVLEDAVERLKDLSVSVIRGDKAALANEVNTALVAAARKAGLTLSASDLAELTAQVIARVGGLGFLHSLIYHRAAGPLSEIAVNPDGSIWILPKGKSHFERAPLNPAREEVMRSVEALLAPLGRALTEATPSVDAKLPREAGFGGARVKVLHPVVCPGTGFPSINIRLFEPKPVAPEQIIQWQVAPEAVVRILLEAVSRRARVLIVGGTNTGKTTLLSALARGIPESARVVKIEDPEEIWLAHANVVTLEARPAPPGSDVSPYTIRNGVDDAMRMSPHWLVVGEVRTGDAALALFRAQMSDHPGLSTFHAEGPDEAVFRMALIMFADAQIKLEAAKGIFEQAVDLVVHVGWLNMDGTNRRRILGVYQTEGMPSGKGDVRFKVLWKADMESPLPYVGRRGGGE